MKTIGRFALILLIVSLYSIGCKRKPKYTAEYLDSLQNTFASLNAEVDSSWKTMINEDDKKILYLKRMLEEVSGKQKFNPDEGMALIRRVASLPDARYDQQSMASSALIDSYDSLTIQIMDDTEAYLHSWPGFGHDPDLVYMDSIAKSMDNNVLIQRIHYDGYAKTFNRFVRENLEVLEKIVPDGNFKPKPLFELNPTNN